MKANELMIGDIIQFHGSPYIIEELSVKGWVHITDIKYGLRISMSSDYIFNHIKGLPLTEAILYANGYQREIIADTVYFVSPDRRLTLHNDSRYLNSNRKWYIHIDSVTMSTIGCAEFTYVHELQHILGLFKFDKKIIVKKD